MRPLSRVLPLASLAFLLPAAAFAEPGVVVARLVLQQPQVEATPPADWLAFREKVQKSEGVLFISPEYNRSIPGVLKNAIDVGSRPYGKSSFLGKPTGIVTNSPGPLGGISAAKHLQNILPGISGSILGQPEIYLNGVGDAFDDKGELIKESLQAVLKQYIDAYATFVVFAWRDETEDLIAADTVARLDRANRKERSDALSRLRPAA